MLLLSKIVVETIIFSLGRMLQFCLCIHVGTKKFKIQSLYVYHQYLKEKHSPMGKKARPDHNFLVCSCLAQFLMECVFNTLGKTN